jgi:hypothetical protein
MGAAAVATARRGGGGGGGGREGRGEAGLGFAGVGREEDALQRESGAGGGEREVGGFRTSPFSGGVGGTGSGSSLDSRSARVWTFVDGARAW